MASRRCMEKEISGNRRHNPDDELSPNISSSLDLSEFEDFKGFQPNRPKNTIEVASHVDTAERVSKEQMISQFGNLSRQSQIILSTAQNRRRMAQCAAASDPNKTMITSDSGEIVIVEEIYLLPRSCASLVGAKKRLPQVTQDENEIYPNDIREEARLRHYGKLIERRISYKGETIESSLFFETKSKTDNKVDRQEESQDIPKDISKYYKPSRIASATRSDREKYLAHGTVNYQHEQLLNVTEKGEHVNNDNVKIDKRTDQGPPKREGFPDGCHPTGFNGTRFRSHNVFQNARGDEYEEIGRSVKRNDGKVVGGTVLRPFRRQCPACCNHTSGFSGEGFRSHSNFQSNGLQECENLSRDQALEEGKTTADEQTWQLQGATGNNHFPREKVVADFCKENRARKNAHATTNNWSKDWFSLLEVYLLIGVIIFMFRVKNTWIYMGFQ